MLLLSFCLFYFLFLFCLLVLRLMFDLIVSVSTDMDLNETFCREKATCMLCAQARQEGTLFKDSLHEMDGS